MSLRDDDDESLGKPDANPTALLLVTGGAALGMPTCWGTEEEDEEEETEDVTVLCDDGLGITRDAGLDEGTMASIAVWSCS